MQQGDYESALPLLETAVQELAGHQDLTTAYANYNLGFTLIQLGRCDEAMPYLEASLQLQPKRHEVKQAIHDARKCEGG
jgi:tetratricopeptide (TPR) repeat protein